jgi:hypothetical protein
MEGVMKAVRNYAIIVGVVLLIVIVGGITWAAIAGGLLGLLYSCLIVLALLLVGAMLFQIYSILMLLQTVRTVRNELKPLIASAQETVGIVQNTAKAAGGTVSAISTITNFTSDVAVAPGLRAVAGVIAGQEVLRVFLRKGQARSRAEIRRQQQLEAMEAAAAGGE